MLFVRVNAVRDVAGSHVRILVDAIETCGLAPTMKTGHALKDADVLWL